MKIALSLAFLLLWLGCATVIPIPTRYPGRKGDVRRVIPIWLDVKFTGMERQGILNALEEWQLTSNGALKFVIENESFDMEPADIVQALWRDGFLFLRINSNNPKLWDSPGQQTFAWSNAVGGNWAYFVHDRLAPSDWKPVAMHEIGHLLGVNHGGTCLMQRYYYRGACMCVDKYTAERVETELKLLPNSFAWCERRPDEKNDNVGTYGL